MTENIRSLKTSAITIFALTLWVCVTPFFAGEPLSREKGAAKQSRILAQKLVEDLASEHPEVTGIELAATPPRQQYCVTIAATEAKEIGEKCDQDEFTAIRTGKPFVEKEADGFDVTLPIHDATGRIIGTMGMDFKPQSGQQESAVVERAEQIARELEKQVPSRAKLFEPAE